MKLSPVSFNLNKQVKNNKTQNQPKLRPMASDSISFSAKIPTNLQAELKYQKLLQEDEKGKLTYLAESTDPEVLKLLKQMKDDKTVSDEFKINFLTRQYGEPFEKRVELGRKNSDYHSKVALAMLDLMPEEYRYCILSCNALSNASIDMTKVLLSSHQERQLFGRWGSNDRFKNSEPFIAADDKKRQAILACCDEELQRKLLLDPYLVHFRPLHEILAVAPNKQIKMEIFQVLTKNGKNNILHEVDSEKLEYYLNKCNLKKYPDALAKLLLQENEDGYIPIETVGPDVAQMLLEAVPDKETLNAILSRKTDSGETVVNRCKNKSTPVIIANAPNNESKKMLLTTKAQYWGNLPIARLDLEDKKALIKLSPDDETKKIQLTTPNTDGELPIDKDDALWFLAQSPDDETLMLQLDERRTWEYKGSDSARYLTRPIKSSLSFDDYFKAFNMMKNVSSIKETLLSEWQEHKKDGLIGWEWGFYLYGVKEKDYTNNTANVITKDIVFGMKQTSWHTASLFVDKETAISKAHKQQEKLYELLIRVIEDDLTTTDEAIKLIELYKQYMPEAKKNYLSQLEQYFKSQVQ